MRPIRWLHISDLHLHESNDRPQKTVLTAMLSDITKRHKDGLTFDFVLVTGDLAFSGKISEYELVKEFFNQLSSAVGLSRNMIFCVPGNHDIDRERQKNVLCRNTAKTSESNRCLLISRMHRGARDTSNAPE